MKIIALPRGAGKTTQLIRMSAETGYYIVVPYHVQAVDVRNTAEAMELQIPFPLTASEVMQKQMGPGVKGILVDNMEQILAVLFGSTPIHAATITTSDEMSDVSADKETAFMRVDDDSFFRVTTPFNVSQKVREQAFGSFLSALQARVYERVQSHQPNELYVAADVLAHVTKLDGYEPVDQHPAPEGSPRIGFLRRHGLSVYGNPLLPISTGELRCSDLGVEGRIEFKITK